MLLFEVVALQARDPARFGSLTPVRITDFLEPLEASLRNRGLSRREPYGWSNESRNCTSAASGIWMNPR